MYQNSYKRSMFQTTRYLNYLKSKKKKKKNRITVKSTNLWI